MSINNIARSITATTLTELAADIAAIPDTHRGRSYIVNYREVYGTVVLAAAPPPTLRGYYYIEQSTDPASGLTAYHSVDRWVVSGIAIPGLCVMTPEGYLIFNTYENDWAEIQTFVGAITFSKMRTPPLALGINLFLSIITPWRREAYLHPRVPAPPKPLNLHTHLDRFWGAKVVDVILKGN